MNPSGKVHFLLILFSSDSESLELRTQSYLFADLGIPITSASPLSLTFTRGFLPYRDETGRGGFGPYCD